MTVNIHQASGAQITGVFILNYMISSIILCYAIFSFPCFRCVDRPIIDQNLVLHRDEVYYSNIQHASCHYLSNGLDHQETKYTAQNIILEKHSNYLFA